MTAPRNGGHGTIHHVATTALTEAEDLEREATEMELKAREKRRTATTLRQLHAIAAPSLGQDEAA